MIHLISAFLPLHPHRSAEPQTLARPRTGDEIQPRIDLESLVVLVSLVAHIRDDRVSRKRVYHIARGRDCLACVDQAALHAVSGYSDCDR